jgi:hypothetical protein|tara:strand:+ start:734 stop:955 length:222 start_codon:yes stop_codon:yes gene_type:complete
MFTLDEKNYDETKLKDEGKIALVQLQNIAQRKQEIGLDLTNLDVLAKHWTDKLKENLPEEEKPEKDKKEKVVL